MKAITKQSIKKLAHAINDALNAASYAAEMNALIDYGEFSGDFNYEDFKPVIKAWNLDRVQLMACIDLAEYYAKIELVNYTPKYHPWGPDMPFWEQTIQLLHCPFINGDL